MSLFLSKALRRAEVFLEQVDESVAQASRRLVVEGVTGSVKDNEKDLLADEEKSSFSRASSIPTAEYRTRPAVIDETENPNLDGWGNDIVISEASLASVDDKPRSHPDEISANLDQTRSEPETKSQMIAELTTPDDSAPGDIAESSQTFNDVVERDAASTNEVTFENGPQLSTANKSTAAEISTETTNAKPIGHQTPSVVPPDSQGTDEFVAALKAENTELRRELENIELEYESSRHERTKLVNSIKRMKEVVSEMDETLRDKSSEVRDLQKQLLQSKEEIETSQIRFVKVEAAIRKEMDNVQNDLTLKISHLTKELNSHTQEVDTLRQENERLKEALLQGHEVEAATADGARQDASQAHLAYEDEANAHRETRRLAKEREEALQEEAALAARALATAQRKAEEYSTVASDSKATLRSMEAKLAATTQARDTAFARISDLEEALRLYERREGEEAPGQREAKTMQQTVSELENALEAKNVELSRLEGEVEALRASTRVCRDPTSPRAAGVNRSDATIPQEVETKLRHMADAALRKQAQLEVLRSENRALQHQLSTECKRTREAQAMAAAASSSRHSIRGGFKGILGSSESDFGSRMFGVRDGPLARFRIPQSFPPFIAKLIGGLDRISAQALAILRKEPLLRIVVMIYVVAIHLFIYSLLHWHVETVSRSSQATQIADMQKHRPPVAAEK